MPKYTRNHYVPRWFQHRFIPPAHREGKFYYLDRHPETQENNGHTYQTNPLRRWGPRNCFCQDDLYTTTFGNGKSTEIEEKFFGSIDEQGKAAVEYFAHFAHPSADPLLSKLDSRPPIWTACRRSRRGASAGVGHQKPLKQAFWGSQETQRRGPAESCLIWTA